MIIEILFACSVALYVIYHIIEKYEQKMDYDLINSLSLIAQALEEGDSLESAITDISHGSDKASLIFRKILTSVKQGLTLTEAFEAYEKKYNSLILKYISTLITAYEKSGEDISEQLNEIADSLLKLESNEKELYAKTMTAVMTLQVIAIFIAPFGVVFIARLLNSTLYSGAYLFMIFSVLVFGFLDYIMYADLAKTICIMPLFLTSYLIIVTIITPYITNYFLNFI